MYSTLKLTIMIIASWKEKHLSDLIQSPALRAPEVTIGAPWDSGVDIWSLGCLVRAPLFDENFASQLHSDYKLEQVMEFVQGIVLFSGEASSGGIWTAEDDHLARMIEILGQFPSHFIAKGHRAAHFFDKQGKAILPVSGFVFYHHHFNMS